MKSQKVRIAYISTLELWQALLEKKLVERELVL